MNDNVFLIGARYPHHAAHSGYEGFCRWGGSRLGLPVNFREAVSWKTKRWGFLSRELLQRIDNLAIAIAKRPGYSLAALLAEGAGALQMLKRRGCIFHVLYGDTDLSWLGSMSRITKNRLVATFHQPPAGMEMLAVNSRITKNLAAAVIVSDSQREYLTRLLPPERIFTVPHGVDTDFFRPAQKLSEEPVCITVGAHWRDFYTLEQAIYRIWEVNPEMRFIAVGTDRYKGNRLDMGLNIRDSRVQYLVRLTDEQLRDAYQKARVAVFSFWDATANNSLLEAMACGLPVVSTDIGGIHEYLGDEAGLLCPHYDPEALDKAPKATAGAVLRLLDDRSLAGRMGAAGRARALQFDYKVVARQMSGVYSRILVKSAN